MDFCEHKPKISDLKESSMYDVEVVKVEIEQGGIINDHRKIDLTDQRFILEWEVFCGKESSPGLL